MPPDRKADILYLNHVAQMSGAEASLLSLLDYLDTSAFRPIVGAPGPGPFVEALQQADIEVALLEHPRLRRRLNPLALLRQYVALRQGAQRIADFVEDRGIDLVHANSLSSAICAAHALAGGLPLVWHARDLRLPPEGTRWAARRVAAVIAISHAVAEAVSAIAPEAAARTRVVHNGIDADAFSPRDSRRKVRQALGLPDDVLLVGGVGQLIPWKNWPRFLRVGADVAARVPNVHLLVIGGDLFGNHLSHRQELEALADDLAIGRLTHFLGYRRDIPDLVSALDVFLHCADDEPLGRALMEAMALERPVVAVAAAGPAEIVVDEESGLLAPPRNTYAIADRVVRILKDADLARRLGAAARLRVQNSFRPERTARLTEEVYREVLWETGNLAVG